MAIRHCILVRHAQYVLDKEHADHGLLTTVGHRQAEQVGRHLLKRLPYCDSILTSTAPRAQQTAEHIASYWEEARYTKHSFLREILPALSRDDLHGPPIAGKDGPTGVQLRARLWRDPELRDRAISRLPEAERRLTELAQAEKAADRVFRPLRNKKHDRYEIVVCHGNIIRYLVCLALEAEPALWTGMSSSHCGITEIRILPDGEAVLDCYNDTGFLRNSLRTW